MVVVVRIWSGMIYHKTTRITPEDIYLTWVAPRGSWEASVAEIIRRGGFFSRIASSRERLGTVGVRLRRSQRGVLTPYPVDDGGLRWWFLEGSVNTLDT